MKYLAFDLGADSGRAMLGDLSSSGLRLTEVHRFPNVPVSVRGTLHWDTLRLWHEIQQGLRKAVHEEPEIQSLGLDTWGCDFALLDAKDRMMHTPVHYRDARTTGVMDAAFETVSQEQIFELAGTQFIMVNTLFQLLAVQRDHPADLDQARTFLTMPDLFNFWLTGQKVNEFTNASTTQCLNPRTMTWSLDLLHSFGLPTGIFQEVVHPGFVVGTSQVSDCPAIAVVAPACHDTGSAVAAVPAGNADYIWISSGTWSIMGVVVPEAILSSQALRHNFTNEGGIDRTYRFCKNIMGLWLLQECRRTWESEGSRYSYAELGEMSHQEDRAVAIVDPDHDSFLAPGEMPRRIQKYCLVTGQPVPDSKAEILRCINDSLALKYRWVLTRMEETLERVLDPIHIVGGGSRNEGLNQATADATNRLVVAGPAEATATGNVMVQAVASGEIDSFQEIGAVVRGSVSTREFEPAADQSGRVYWDDSFRLLQSLMANPPVLP